MGKVKINNIDKLSPYTFTQDDIISIITIENNSKEIVYVTLEKIKLTNQNKIQFKGDNIVLDIKKCYLENCTTTTAKELEKIFLDYTGSNIYIPTNEDILKNNYHLCKCNFISPESIQVGPDTSNITQTYPNFDLTTTFTLHSKPGSSKFIYLNFIGGNVTNTLWNTYSNIETIVVRPFGNNIVFADEYKTQIQYIWRAVSEAYSIWDVDVTTERPSSILNTFTSTSYGVQCYIGGSYSDWFQYPAGGVAFLFSFNLALPCFVFSENLGNGSKYIADAINHEIGHTLGLYHDGTSSADYYTGHSNWAPIMGVGYFSNVVQWSTGDYASANNKQDDIAIISTYLTPIADDHTNNFTNASFIQNGDFIGGIINNKTDVDFFTFYSNAGEINLNVDVTVLSPTAKIGMALYNSQLSTTPIATNTINNTMNANITHSVTSPGKYYLKIAGVGGNGVDLSGNPTTSFNDYGSIGRYKITGSWPEYNPISINNVIVTGINKVYDGNTNASVTITSNDIIPGDNVSFNYTSASFNNKNVTTNKTVTLSGITITGNDANKYILNVPTTQVTTASISPKPLTINGVTAKNKIYDGKRTANVNMTYSQLSGVITGEKVVLNKPNVVNGLFSDKIVGINKNITVNTFSISGTNASNYSLIQPLIIATITPKPLSITGTTFQNKIYDGTSIAYVNVSLSKLTTPIINDVVVLNKNNVSGLFSDKIVGTNKSITITGFNITGIDAANYSFIQPNNIIATITKRELYITGTTAENKIYNRNNIANVITSNSQLSNKISSDSITLIKTNVRGYFFSPKVGNNKNVTITGFSINGNDTNNYKLIQPKNVFANIISNSTTLTIIRSSFKNIMFKSV
jgi:serralysin